jgi:hypothetical protein
MSSGRTGSIDLPSENVCHHVDYKSKTDMRKRELEELRKRSLAKAEGTKLEKCVFTHDREQVVW